MLSETTDLGVQLTYIGHATTLIELNGVRLLTDPVLRRRVLHLRHRQATPLWPADRPLDAVLISHLHFDHLDLPSLRLLGPNVPLIVPRGAGVLLRRAGFGQVHELGVDETLPLKSITIRGTYAHHPNRRHPFGLRADCLGYMIEDQTTHRTLYFAGDTDLFPAMASLADSLDVALLPVWGWGPTLGKGHMNPLRAAEALTMLRPQLAIPIHWGSLHPWGVNWFKTDFLTTPPHEFLDHAAQLAPDVQALVVPPGQTIALNEYLA
jgi:L-ascorbate metabolism protein UlaG (beta-lactamase superfamily)